MIVEAVISFLLIAGAAFALLASIGLVRMPDVFTRMQASSKASTLGLGCLLAGTALQFGDVASIVRAASIAAFVLLTLPVSTHVIARAAALRQVRLWAGTIVDERVEAVTRDQAGGAGDRGAGDSDPADHT